MISLKRCYSMKTRSEGASHVSSIGKFSVDDLAISQYTKKWIQQKRVKRYTETHSHVEI